MQGKYFQQNWHFLPTNFLIEKTLDGKLFYIKDGEILKQEQSANVQLENILRNLEQIQNLTWNGYYNQKNQKVGNWKAFWSGRNLKVGGNYDENGKKIGKWIELFKNYWDQCEMKLVGEYYNGNKIGIWYYFYDKKMISLGIYNNQGLKNGMWVDVHKNFWNRCQVKFIGNYKSGLKIGKWDTLFQQKYSDTYDKIGGGFFDDNGIKQGNWIELQESFSDSFFLTYEGEYKLGKKINRWNLYFGRQEIQDYHVGGGSYDNDGQKMGIWIESFENQSGELTLIQKGEYQKQKKVGKWNFLYQNKIIGEGVYNQNGLKIDKWVELHQNFSNDCQIIYIGQYSEGIKQGKWDIMFKCDKINLKKYMKIGGGMYDQKGKQNGLWIDVDDTFQNQSQISYQGEYKKGLKIGKWDYVLNRNNTNKLNIIGGGFYEYDGKKKGQWIYFHSKFANHFQVIYLGQYNNGIKIGKWEIKYRFETKEELKKAGVGNYDYLGKKIGKWIDIDFEFQFGYDLVHIGNYLKGFQQGNFVKQMLPLKS